MWIIYQLGTAILFLLAGPFLLLTRGARALRVLPHRLALRPPAAHPNSCWLHAVSVGEVGVAETLAGALPEDLPLLVTTVTPTGQERAIARLGARAAVTFLPFELGGSVRRFFRHFEPEALILVEGDLWPLVLRESQRRDLPIVVVNGRISDRSFRRMSRLRPWLSPLLEPVSKFCVQTPADRDRLVALGVPGDRIRITGNIKFDSAAPEPIPELEDRVRTMAGSRPILIAGSTMPGEEPILLDAYEKLLAPRPLLMLAPRHPERWDEVERLLQSRNLPSIRRTQIAKQAGEDVILLDSLGELASIYSLGSSAFIGGTLVPTGGHNPLEPARLGIPVIAGPSMHNFQEISDKFETQGAWQRVANAEDLARVWASWAGNPEIAIEVGIRGQNLIEANRGALRQTLEELQPVLKAMHQAESTVPPPANE